MGGLLARMQTIDSGDKFWNILSDQPISSVRGDPNTVKKIHDLFYFDADPSVKHVVTIATPHRGSNYANVTTRWLSHKFLRLPTMLTTDFTNFVNDNEGILYNTRHLTVPTSVDSLSPQSPFIEQLAERKLNSNVKFHNIVGSLAGSKFFGNSEGGDGVVSLSSARLPGAISEIEVPAEHMHVHQHPEAILEVKRILIENLALNKKIQPQTNSGHIKRVIYESDASHEPASGK